MAKKLEKELILVGNLKLTGKNKENLMDLGVPEEKCTYNMMLAISAFDNAIDGNSKYLDLIMSALGVKQADRIANKRALNEEKKIKADIESKNAMKEVEDDEL